MKICIYGAGGTGSVLGDKFNNIGEEITLIARGKHLSKLQSDGLHMITRDEDKIINLKTLESPKEAGIQDYVIIASKAYSIPEIAENISPLLGENTAIIPSCNGIPWWFLYGLDCPLKNQRLDSLDPDGIIEKNIDFERVIGGLVYMAATLVKPGEVTSFAHPRFIIGEPNGEITDRVKKLDESRVKAGFRDSLAKNIRTEILQKLCWNVAFNPIAAITGKDSGEMAEDKEIRDLAVKIMHEMAQIANSLNIPLPLDTEFHIELARKAGKHKPSMLQDVENGKKLEIDAIIGSVSEISHKLGLKTPNIDKTYENLKKIA